jgi:hypothetical protein
MVLDGVPSYLHRGRLVQRQARWILRLCCLYPVFEALKASRDVSSLVRL